MAEHQLLDLSLVESSIDTAINSSIMDFNNSINNDIDVWAQTDLRRNVESNLSRFSGMQSGGQNSFNNPPGGGNGFKFTIGLQIQLGYKVRVKAGMNLGYQKRWGNVAANTSLHLNVYNGGLGTPVNSNDFQFDVTAAANVIVGSGHGKPLQSYSLNHNSPIPTLNEFQNSIRYGQLLTYNSALNENNFSFDNLQREGMFGFRVGNVNVSTSNDTARIPYFGGGTDHGFTGSISVVTPLLEVGFIDFTGKYDPFDDVLTDELNKKIDNATSDFEKSLYKQQLKDLTDSRYHKQNPYQKSLNKASTYLRFNQNGTTKTLDVIGDGWLQDIIHKKISNFRFEYDHKDIELWEGSNF